MIKMPPQPADDSNAQEKIDVKARAWAPPEPVKSGWKGLDDDSIKNLIRDEEAKCP